MELLLPSARRPRFHVTLAIHDLTNVPLVSGLVHVRWHLRDSLRSETRGRTGRALIRDHRVTWDYEVEWSVRLAIDRGRKLGSATLELQVFQETQGGRERHSLGSLTADLAEHAGNRGLRDTRRYLLQDAKVNATLRVSLTLAQLSGDTNFVAPELHKAQVFGGITGILSEGKEEKKKQQQHQGRGQEESSDEPETKRYERDFYRDNVTRRWQREAGERDPDKVIEDIFAGGDGWARPAAPQGDHDRILDNEGRSSGEDQAYRKILDNRRRAGQQGRRNKRIHAARRYKVTRSSSDELLDK